MARIMSPSLHLTATPCSWPVSPRRRHNSLRSTRTGRYARTQNGAIRLHQVPAFGAGHRKPDLRGENRLGCVHSRCSGNSTCLSPSLNVYKQDHCAQGKSRAFHNSEATTRHHAQRTRFPQRRKVSSESSRCALRLCPPLGCPLLHWVLNLFCKRQLRYFPNHPSTRSHPSTAACTRYAGRSTEKNAWPAFSYV